MQALYDIFYLGSYSFHLTKIHINLMSFTCITFNLELLRTNYSLWSINYGK